MPLHIAAEPLPLRTDMDGVVRVGNTRVTLDTLFYTYCDGATAEEIMQQYPSLHLGDVYLVIGYCLKHRAELDAYLREREQLASEVRQENEVRFDPQSVHDRLIARCAHY